MFSLFQWEKAPADTSDSIVPSQVVDRVFHSAFQIRRPCPPDRRSPDSQNRHDLCFGKTIIKRPKYMRPIHCPRWVSPLPSVRFN
jgi:hypothetical protein